MKRDKFFLAALSLAALVLIISCSVRKEAPKANPELTQSKEDAPAASQEEQKAEKEKAKKPPEEEKKPLPKLDGFNDIRFGLSFDRARKDKAIKQRCKDKLKTYVAKPEYAGQEIKERSLFCTATIAERYVQLDLNFDHNDELYSIEFSFDDPSYFGGSAASRKKKKLYSTEIEKFVADVRAFLDEELGEPKDSSSAGFSGRDINLKWPAETSDTPPHQSGVEINMRSGLSDWQEVKWIDYDREKAFKDAIEKEKTDRIKAKGL